MDVPTSTTAKPFFFCRLPSQFRARQQRRPPVPFPRPRALSEQRERARESLRRSSIRSSSRRRNALREKLLFVPEQDQVRSIPPPLENPSDDINDKLYKLETWVRQHEQNLEGWGDGSDPVFRFSRDSDGNVVRVSVNEEGEEEDSKPVSNEIESTRPSSIDSLRSVLIQRMPFVRALSLTGFTVLCAFCVLGVVAKLFAGNDEVELGREEADMLRRKKKSRMERERLEEGGARVIQHVEELPVASGTRPQLDRNELLKRIEHAENKDNDFDSRVRRIREMAREVRKLGEEGREQNGKRENEDELSPAVDVSTSHVLADAHIESHPMKDMKHSGDIENNTSIDIIPDSIASTINPYEVTTNADVHETDTSLMLKGLQNSVENSDYGINSSVLISQDLKNEEVKQNETDSVNLIEKESSCISSGILSSVKRVPKIMKSVEEAKEYLLQKHGISNDNLQTNQAEQLNYLALDVSAADPLNNNITDAKRNQALNKNNKARHSTDLTTDINGDVDSTSLLNGSFADDISEKKVHEVDTKNAVFSMKVDDNRLSGENNPDLPINNLITDEILYSSKNALGAVDPEKTCSGTDKIKKLNAEQRLIENQSGRNNYAHTFYTSNNSRGSESRETCCNDSSSVVTFLGDIQGRVENGAHDSKQLRIFPNQKPFNSKEERKACEDGSKVCNVTTNGPKVNNSRKLTGGNQKIDSPDTTSSDVRFPAASSLNGVEFDGSASRFYPVNNDKSEDLKPFIPDATLESGDNHDTNDLASSKNSFQLDSPTPEQDNETFESNGDNSWLENNFQQLDPIIKTISTGFRENYSLAKERVQQSAVSAGINELGLLGDDEELEWMKDEKLREIVFQVRDNELAGRDPFHLIDDVDQRAFFKGLELKAEKLNGKLSGLHEWVHSRIENLDYGSDGISLHDPLEKIVPRWKGPSIDKELNFLGKSTHEMTNFAGNDKTLNGFSTSGKTIIESSDGSSKPGKKKGKEHWQHTKKWSRGFLEVYNAETDPEIKSIMKDMGKGLDRWITEKETQEVADLMTGISERKKIYIQKKMDKLKREMDMYGAQAVLSKYREYSDEKEEDFLWWLDLQFVLCIELYTVEDGKQKVGFYSLEMAADLELQPKQYHVIAFEDPNDSKNFCYIVQAHMDMLGSGRAFVVARPPKDTFREAKANGFNVTVIKKGQVKFNVDNSLEEVEEEITEVGSKIYHDKIIRERGVDTRTIMRGLILADKAARR
ncbi:uncharacterized protein A4U43_C01F14440 [Asparagus officinalis]|uniref:Uncharacterized protein n=1 Tax=Asparagus officinalis TaxID=4686 RepID=A0A5P1FTV8_ASPOF|nr:uncharacterized protein A4U43_C01F14440 [Asparagus officinalis]